MARGREAATQKPTTVPAGEGQHAQFGPSGARILGGDGQPPLGTPITAIHEPLSAGRTREAARVSGGTSVHDLPKVTLPTATPTTGSNG